MYPYHKKNNFLLDQDFRYHSANLFLLRTGANQLTQLQPPYQHGQCDAAAAVWQLSPFQIRPVFVPGSKILFNFFFFIKARFCCQMCLWFPLKLTELKVICRDKENPTVGSSSFVHYKSSVESTGRKNQVYYLQQPCF